MAKRSPDLVVVEALEAFTVTREYGQFHGDPDSERNCICKVPSDAVDELVAAGKASLPDAVDVDAKPNLPQLDHDGDGNPGGSTSGGNGDEIAALRARYQEIAGKKPFNGWSAEELEGKIANLEAARDADAPPA